MSSFTYEDIAAFLGETAGTVPAGATLQTFLSDAGTTIGTGWTTIKSGANGVVNSVRTLAAEGVSSGTALLTMDVGVAGAVAAPLLGVAAGVGLYSLAPDFWTSVSNKLVAAGSTIGGKVYGFLTADGKVAFDENTIQAFNEAFQELGVYDGQIVQEKPQGVTANIDLPISTGTHYVGDGSVGRGTGFVIGQGTGSTIADPKYLYLSAESVPYTMGQLFQAIQIRDSNGINRLVVASTAGHSGRIGISSADAWAYAANMAAYTLNDLTAYYFSVNLGSNVNWFMSSGSAQQKSAEWDNNLIKAIAWTMLYGTATDLYMDADATKPFNFPSIADFMDALGQGAISIPGVGDDNYILNPTGDATQDGVLDPSIDWDKLWEWLMNPAQELTDENVIDIDIDGIIDSIQDLVIPGAVPVPEDLPVQPDPPIPVPPGIIPPIPSAQSSGKLFEVYSVSASDLNTLGGYLWSTDILTQLQKIWSNPLEGVIALFRIWASPSLGTSKQVHLGAVGIPGLYCPTVSNQIKRINLGTVNVAELNQNVGDYSPYTQVSLYLPFIGIVELDTDEIMAGSLNLQYAVDFWTGTCVAELRFTKSGATDNALLYVYNGNLAQQIPLTSVSFNGMFSALLAAGSAIGTVATGGALAPAMVMGAGAVMTRDMVHVHRAGLISSNAGIMTNKTPHLIINRRNVYNATQYNELTGYPANKTKYLGNCSGFTRVRGINLQVSATQDEKTEIEEALREGVIF